MARMALARQHLLGATALGVLFCACGCTDLVTIYSEPPGAKCYIDGEFRGKTPIETPVKSWAGGRARKIRLEKAGCEPFEGLLPKKVQDSVCHGALISDYLVSGGYGFLLRDADREPAEMPPHWAGKREMVIQGRQPGIGAEIALQQLRAAELAEQERREERAALEAGRKPVELMLAARWIPFGGSSSISDDVHIHHVFVGGGLSATASDASHPW